MQPGSSPAVVVLSHSKQKTIMKVNYCISVDWLQVYCTCNNFVFEKQLYAIGRVYDVALRAQGSKLWTEVYDITSRGRDFATFCRAPRSSAIDKNACTLKLANRVLYSCEYVDILRELINLLGLHYVGITRLDLCYDCNYLADGSSVGSFLMQFFSHAPYCEGHIIRKGSRRVIINGTRSSSGATGISAMRWGSPCSDIGAYCYNKSLELLEVKDKPWIRETWEKNGLINAWNKTQWDELSEGRKQKVVNNGDTDEFISTPVWRFEISIKAHGKDLLNIDTGELFRLSPSFLESQASVENLFHVYAQKVLCFRKSTGQTKIRDYPDYPIFVNSQKDISLKPYNVSLFADTGRTEKMIVNRLEQLQETYSDIAGVEKTSIEAALEFVRVISGVKRSRVVKLKQLQYLSHMAGYKSKSAPISEYLAFVEWARLERKQIDADCSYGYWKSLQSSIYYDLMKDEISGFDSEITPVY